MKPANRIENGKEYTGEAGRPRTHIPEEDIIKAEEYAYEGCQTGKRYG